MRDFTVAELAPLIEEGAPPWVSVYLPTHRTGPEIEGDPIRLRNLLETAADLLVARGFAADEIGPLLEPGRALVEDDGAWLHQDRGLAFFSCPGRSEIFRLPVAAGPSVVVDDAPQLRPLLDLVDREMTFGILALSRNSVRYLRATPADAQRIALPPGTPSSLEEATRFEDPEKQLQSHATRRVGRGRVVAGFHGHGVPDERDEVRVADFLRRVDRGLATVHDRSWPLLLAGVDDITATFRRVTGESNVLDEVLIGNADRVEDRVLHDRALPIISRWRSARVEADAESFLESPELQATSVEDVAIDAMRGRVAIAFVPADVHVWGEVGDGGVTTTEDSIPGTRDLLDLIAVAAWQTGATVHVLERTAIPGGGDVAALLRY